MVVCCQSLRVPKYIICESCSVSDQLTPFRQRGQNVHTSSGGYRGPHRFSGRAKTREKHKRETQERNTNARSVHRVSHFAFTAAWRLVNNVGPVRRSVMLISQSTVKTEETGNCTYFTHSVRVLHSLSSRFVRCGAFRVRFVCATNAGERRRTERWRTVAP